MASFQDRVVGVLRLQASTFEEIEHDASATSQAAMVVVPAAVSSAIGTAGVGGGIVAAILGIVFSLIGWAIGSAVIWLVGTRIFPGKNTEADYGQLLRVVGYAQAPGLLGILRIVPVLGYLVAIAIAVWGLVAAIIGVRQALDYEDTLKAVIVCVVAWLIIIAMTMVVGLLGLGAGAALY